MSWQWIRHEDSVDNDKKKYRVLYIKYRPRGLGWLPLATKTVEVWVRASNVRNTSGSGAARLVKFECFLKRGGYIDASGTGVADTVDLDCKLAQESLRKMIQESLSPEERRRFKTEVVALIRKIQ